MSAQAVETEILAPMQRQFYPPKQNMPANDQAAALRDYVHALEGFDAADLKTAWAEVCATHTKPAWPLPSVFVAAARVARKERAPANVISEREKHRAEAARRWETWVAVSHGELGREAARRDVSWSLKCLILHDGKKPEEIDLRALVIAKASAERTADSIRHGRPIPWKGRDLVFTGDNARLALTMWENQLTAEARTQAEINYGAAA